MTPADVPRSRPSAVAATSTAGSGRVVIVGIGQLAVAVGSGTVLCTHALGSCVAVCIWDPVTCAGGLLHYLLPQARASRDRGREQPAAFADTGIPLLFQMAHAKGLDKGRCSVRLVGGAEVSGLGDAGALNIGRLNLLAAHGILRQDGVPVGTECTGGHIARTVHFHLADGRVEVTSGPELITTL